MPKKSPKTASTSFPLLIIFLTCFLTLISAQCGQVESDCTPAFPTLDGDCCTCTLDDITCLGQNPALPVFDVNTCSCVCDKNDQNCSQNYLFDSHTCSCQCSLKHTDCNDNEIVDDDSCQCKCNITQQDCSQNYVFNQNNCSCDCNLDQSSCSTNEIFRSNTCDCSCGITQTDCRGGNIFDSPNCQCDCPITSSNCKPNETFDSPNCECTCALTQADCPSNYTFVAGNCECLCGLNQSNCGPNETFDSTGCKCTCGLTPSSCSSSSHPTFNSAACQCECNLSQDDCTQNFHFNSATCQCEEPVCNLTQHDCTGDKPVFNQDKCQCEACQISAAVCSNDPYLTHFDSETCQCYHCDLDSNKCAQEPVNTKFDVNNCQCIQPCQVNEAVCAADKTGLTYFNIKTCSCEEPCRYSVDFCALQPVLKAFDEDNCRCFCDKNTSTCLAQSIEKNDKTSYFDAYTCTCIEPPCLTTQIDCDQQPGGLLFNKDLCKCQPPASFSLTCPPNSTLLQQEGRCRCDLDCTGDLSGSGNNRASHLDVSKCHCVKPCGANQDTMCINNTVLNTLHVSDCKCYRPCELSAAKCASLASQAPPGSPDSFKNQFHSDSCSCISPCGLTCTGPNTELDSANCQCKCTRDCPPNQSPNETCSDCVCQLNDKMCALGSTNRFFDSQLCACVPCPLTQCHLPGNTPNPHFKLDRRECDCWCDRDSLGCDITQDPNETCTGCIHRTSCSLTQDQCTNLNTAFNPESCSCECQLECLLTNEIPDRNCNSCYVPCLTTCESNSIHYVLNQNLCQCECSLKCPDGYHADDGCELCEVDLTPCRLECENQFEEPDTDCEHCVVITDSSCDNGFTCHYGKAPTEDCTRCYCPEGKDCSAPCWKVCEHGLVPNQACESCSCPDNAPSCIFAEPDEDEKTTLRTKLHERGTADIWWHGIQASVDSSEVPIIEYARYDGIGPRSNTQFDWISLPHNARFGDRHAQVPLPVFPLDNIAVSVLFRVRSPSNNAINILSYKEFVVEKFPNCDDLNCESIQSGYFECYIHHDVINSVSYALPAVCRCTHDFNVTWLDSSCSDTKQCHDRSADCLNFGSHGFDPTSEGMCTEKCICPGGQAGDKCEGPCAKNSCNKDRGILNPLAQSCYCESCHLGYAGKSCEECVYATKITINNVSRNARSIFTSDFRRHRWYSSLSLWLSEQIGVLPEDVIIDPILTTIHDRTIHIIIYLTGSCPADHMIGAKSSFFTWFPLGAEHQDVEEVLSHWNSIITPEKLQESVEIRDAIVGGNVIQNTHVENVVDPITCLAMKNCPQWTGLVCDDYKDHPSCLEKSHIPLAIGLSVSFVSILTALLIFCICRKRYIYNQNKIEQERREGLINQAKRLEANQNEEIDDNESTERMSRRSAHHGDGFQPDQT